MYHYFLELLLHRMYHIDRDLFYQVVAFCDREYFNAKGFRKDTGVTENIIVSNWVFQFEQEMKKDE